MNYEVINAEPRLEDIQMGLEDLEKSLNEIGLMCDGAGGGYCMSGTTLAGLLRMLESVAHVQRVRVDCLVNQQYRTQAV